LEGLNPLSEEKRKKSIRTIELIVILILIILLAAIAVPNFLEAQIRAKKSKNYSPMRTLATVLESYYNDHGAYPPMRSLKDMTEKPDELEKAGGASLQTFSPVLTTPTAYIQRFENDPFSPYPLPFVYYTDGEGWMILSRGPDGDYDINPAKIYNSSDSYQSFSVLASPATYDPSNGTTSNGDIWRIKQ